MRFDDERFAAVATDSFVPCDLTPQPDGDEEGIRIVAPARVTFAPGEADALRVPVCGSFLLPETSVPLGGDPLEYLRLFARDADSGEEFSAWALAPQRRGPAAQEPPEEADPDVSVGGYFNVDLVERVHLPARPGRYEVRVEFLAEDEPGHAKSNLAVVELVREQAEGGAGE
jgi:hypothetical protein